MESQNFVIVCAIMCKRTDGRYALDAARWIQLAENKGVSKSNLFFFGDIMKGYVTEDLRNVPHPQFSITPKEWKRIYKDYYKGDQNKFIEKLKELDYDKVSTLALILINHGTQEGLFGSKSSPLNPEEFCNIVEKIHVPTLFICSACYSPTILNRFAVDNAQNIVRIYDTSKMAGVTRNWGLKNTHGEEIDLGTQLCYWLFDVFYNANDTYEATTLLLSLNGNPKPNEKENICTIHIEGNSKLLQYPFFGKNKTLSQFTQPTGIVTKTYSKHELLYRPLFTIELQVLLEKLEKPTEFWDYCYSNEVMQEVISNKDSMKIVEVIAKTLRDYELIDTENNSSGFVYALVKLNLVDKFMEILSKKYKIITDRINH